MKRILRNIFIAASAACALVSCYGIKVKDYPTLAPITISVLSDTVNALMGQEFVYEGVTVKSVPDVTYEWAVGSPEKGTTISQHQFASIQTISTSPTINYTFTKIGSYILRLKVDNGESIEFHYFTLNVNAGYDEGILILDNAPDGTGELTFVKTLTTEEKNRGEQQLFTIDVGIEIKNGKDLFMSDMTSTDGQQFTALLVATDDGEGTIYHLEPKTMELFATAKMSEWGTYCAEFGGEYARTKTFTNYFLSADGRFFRYDMTVGGIHEMTDVRTTMSRIYPMTNRSTDVGETTRYPCIFSPDSVSIRVSASQGLVTNYPDGYRVIGVGTPRTGYYLYALLQNKSNPSEYKIISGSMNKTWSDPKNIKEVLTFTNNDLKMDINSKMVGVKKSNDLYYNYGNAIYRWGLASQPASIPAITLPSGETLCDFCTNFIGRVKSNDGEDSIIIATYNPSRSGEKKGSVYVYSVETQQMTASYEGICNEPAAIVYKYRIN